MVFVSTTTTTARARIFADGETVGPLDTFEPVMVEAAKLRPGMVLLDPDLNTPAYAIDHRLRAQRGSGSTVWFVEDLEASTGRYRELVLSPRCLVPVAAR